MKRAIVIKGGKFTAPPSEIGEAIASGDYELTFEGELPGFIPAAAHNELALKVNDFRANNVAMLKAAGVDSIDDMLKLLTTVSTIGRDKLEKLKDIDPEEVATLKSKAQRLKEKGVKDESDLEEIIKRAIKPVTDELTNIKQENAQQKAKLAEEGRKNTFTQLGIKVGVLDSAMTDFLGRASGVFGTDGIAKDGEGKPLFSKKNPGQPLTPEEWAAEQMVAASHLFKKSTGGGAGQTAGAVGGSTNGGGTRAGVVDLVNPTPEDLGRHAKDIRAGKMRVVRTDEPSYSEQAQ